jgi:hypothetical protein
MKRPRPGPPGNETTHREGDEKHTTETTSYVALSHNERSCLLAGCVAVIGPFFHLFTSRVEEWKRGSDGFTVYSPRKALTLPPTL